MNPAECVEDILRDVFGVDAVDGVAHVLLGWDDQGEGKHTRRRHRVVEAEHPRVNVEVGHPQEPTKLPEDFQHFVVF